MLFLNKKNCTAETVGTVIRKRWNGNVWFLKVEYTVDGKSYRFSEQLRYTKTKTHKIGGIAVGMQSVLSIGQVQPGDTVRVKYNPQKPKKAFLPDNVGLLLT